MKVNPSRSIVVFSICLLLGVSSANPSAKVKSQQKILPTSIIVSATNDLLEKDFDKNLLLPQYNILALIDENLKISQFYFDEKATLVKALTWSPHGNLLAVVKLYSTSDLTTVVSSICILDIEGHLQRCMDDEPVKLKNWLLHLDLEAYYVTWSADEKYIYFVTENINASENRSVRRLIEADVQTGKTTRTLYQIESIAHPGEAPVIRWTSDLSTLLISVTGVGGSRANLPKIVNLQTHETVELALDRNYDAVLCPDFSLSGMYLSVINVRGQILIYDNHGKIAHKVNIPVKTSNVYVPCPVWSDIEDTFYVYATERFDTTYTSDLYAYSLNENKLERYLPLENTYLVDKSNMAYHEGYLAFEAFTPDEGKGLLAIIYPDKEISLIIRGGFVALAHPIWKPT
jgi:hypothetical protein